MKNTSLQVWKEKTQEAHKQPRSLSPRERWLKSELTGIYETLKTMEELEKEWLFTLPTLQEVHSIKFWTYQKVASKQWCHFFFLQSKDYTEQLPQDAVSPKSLRGFQNMIRQSHRKISSWAVMHKDTTSGSGSFQIRDCQDLWIYLQHHHPAAVFLSAVGHC